MSAGRILILVAVLTANAGSASSRVEILNASGPMEGIETVRLRELWRTDPESDPLYGLIGSAAASESGEIYLLDTQLHEIRAYSPQGRLEKIFGRRGEGPGEFQRPGGLLLMPDGDLGVYETMPGCIRLFHPNGVPAGSLTPGAGAAERSPLLIHEARPVGRLLGMEYLAPSPERDPLVHVRRLALFDAQGRMTRLLHEERARVRMDLFDEIEEGNMRRRWTSLKDGTVFLAPDYHSYRIEAVSPDGSRRWAITRDYESLPRGRAERDRLKELYTSLVRSVPDCEVRVEGSYRDIEELSLGPDGRLWVLPSRGIWSVPEGTLAVYDVFTPDGRYLKQVRLRGEGDPRTDRIWLLGDRVIVARNQQELLRSHFLPGSDSDEMDVSVICYALEMSLSQKIKP